MWDSCTFTGKICGEVQSPACEYQVVPAERAKLARLATRLIGLAMGRGEISDISDSDIDIRYGRTPTMAIII